MSRTDSDSSNAGDVTQIFDRIAGGDENASVRLIERLYEDLKRLAGSLMLRERPDHTLQPTALLHEACFRLMADRKVNWSSRAEFFGAAAEVMRRVLVDYARRRLAAKRGGHSERVALDSSILTEIDAIEDVIGVDEALKQLAATDARKAEVVRLRFFGGLEIEEIAAILEVAPITVKREWRYARAWLSARLKEAGPNSPP